MTPDDSTLRTELESRLRFETLIADLSSKFISLPAGDVDGWMEDAQRRVCDCLALDLSALWQWSDGESPLFPLTHLCRRTEGAPPPGPMDGREQFPWCLEQLTAGEVVVVSSVEHVAAEAARDQASWRRCGIKSTVTFPLVVGSGAPIGALSFSDTQSERVWPEALVNRLELVAHLFTSALARKRADRAAAAALKDRTDRLAMALTSARLGAWDVKLPEMSIAWEPSREDLFGRGPGTFPLHVSELVTHLHPDDHQAVVDTFKQLTREAGTRTLEVRLVWPDGTEHWHEVFARSEGEAGGAPTRMAGLSLDVTDRKTREAELRAALEEVRRLRDQLRDENVYLRQEVKGLQSGLRIVGQSPAILRVLAQAQQVAATASTVLLIGETGTGKERFASAIHELSQRRDRTMVRVNCAAIPATLIESELFGREKGAYTGALSRQAGRFELAHGSSLFLDEIGDLPPEVQVKLLRVLQEKQIERLGSPKPIPVDVRIITATNQNLEAAVAEGRFREDLYYRLNVFPILIPPLRERREDIPLLVAALVDELGATMGKRIDAISKSSMAALSAHSWPGNIRELRNVLERAMILAVGPVLEVEVPRRAEATAPVIGPDAKDAERQHILEVLQRTGWRIRGPHGAAQVLGLKPTTLEHRMARLGIARPGRS